MKAFSVILVSLLMAIGIANASPAPLTSPRMIPFEVPQEHVLPGRIAKVVAVFPNFFLLKVEGGKEAFVVISKGLKTLPRIGEHIFYINIPGQQPTKFYAIPPTPLFP